MRNMSFCRKKNHKSESSENRIVSNPDIFTGVGSVTGPGPPGGSAGANIEVGGGGGGGFQRGQGGHVPPTFFA